MTLPSFAERIASYGWAALTPAEPEILQLNIGRLCNMRCAHCHVDAGPHRTQENMGSDLIDACIRVVDAVPSIQTVDITGGAPELHPEFQRLVDACTQRGTHVIDRCNLTVLLLPRFRDLPEWLAERGVEIVASLPHPRKRNTDAQRGDGTYEKSIQALQRLNEVGYGIGSARRRLTLVHNPAGAFLPGDQRSLEQAYRRALSRVGVSFDRLIALNNMPIARFQDWLEQTGNDDAYAELLLRSFNPAAISGLMCRNTWSVSWTGALYDCDFNQMLDLPMLDDEGHPVTVWTLDPARLQRRVIRTQPHCFGCTAGAGSSCGGATAEEGASSPG